ncbi:MAG TPA: hypothetical protein VJI52_05525 [Candidatus Nanoarchaeia archaeon]|nr:hypothetical protein [Candidatus Nanoarchaeia archaeon]
MGFFKFLKRGSKQGNEAELDLPPAPPPLEGFEDDKDANLPEFPQISAPKEGDFKFDFPEYDKFPDMGKEEDMPEFPDLEDLDKEPTPNMNMPQAQKMVPAFSQAPQMPEPPIHEFNQSPQMQGSDAGAADNSQQNAQSIQPTHQIKHRVAGRVIQSGGSLYVRVDKFKIALDNINVIKNGLRKSDDDLMKLEVLKHEKDKSFDKFKSSLDDLQKKLIFIDKTLFKG